MSKSVLNSSVIIALSHLGYLNHLKHVFDEVLIPQGVYEEICVKGGGLPGDRELRESVEKGLIRVKKVENRVLVNALLDPLSLGEAEALALAVEEEADYVVVDDRLARSRAKVMGLDVIGTLRVLRLFFDAGLLSKSEFLTALEELRKFGFRISNEIIDKVKEES